MSKQTRVSHPIYNLLPTEIEGFDSLAELALDMRWSWNHAADELWRQLDPDLGGSDGNGPHPVAAVNQARTGE
jgi:starch phosphorylase